MSSPCKVFPFGWDNEIWVLNIYIESLWTNLLMPFLWQDVAYFPCFIGYFSFLFYPPGNAWWPWSIAATFGRCHLLSFRTSGRISHVESTVLRCGIQIWIMKSHWIRTWVIFVGADVVFIWDSKYFMITCGGCSCHWRLVSQRCFVAFSPYEMGQSKWSQKVGLLKIISDTGFRNLLCDEEKPG